jgi:hypothetical protein
VTHATAVFTGTSIGLLMWLAMWLIHRCSALSSRALTRVILSTGLACRLAFLVATPTFYAPDEQSHYNYIRYLAEQRAFPVQTSRTDDPSNDWEYYQPPLYYLALVPLYWAADAVWGNPDLTVRLLRGVSILLWGATFWLSGRVLDRLRPSDEAVRSFALGLVCLLPTYAFLSSMLNNDNLLISLGSAVVLLSLRTFETDLGNHQRIRRLLFLGFVLGLALLTKLTAVIYLAWIGGLALSTVGTGLRAPLPRTSPAAGPALSLRIVVRTIGPPLLSAAVAALMWAPWGWRNVVIYGSLTAETVANVPRNWDSTRQAVLGTLHYMHHSFWSVSGIYNNVRGAYPRIGLGISIAATGGWLVGLARRWRETVLLAGRQMGITIAMILATSVNVLLVLRFGVLYGQGQGRFLFPLLLPITLLLGVGMRAYRVLSENQARLHLAGMQITYLVSFTAYSLAVFPRS